MHTIGSGNLRLHFNGGFDGEMILVNKETGQEFHCPAWQFLGLARQFVDRILEYKVEELEEGER